MPYSQQEHESDDCHAYNTYIVCAESSDLCCTCETKLYVNLMFFDQVDVKVLSTADGGKLRLVTMRCDRLPDFNRRVDPATNVIGIAQLAKGCEDRPQVIQEFLEGFNSGTVR